MAEVTSTPPPPGTQPNSSQGRGPQHVTGPRTSTDGANTQEQKSAPEHKTGETNKSTSRFDTAVAVSPSLAHLQPGEEIRGDILRIDGEGRPVLETPNAVYALEPDADLRKNDHIAILIERVEKRAIGKLTEKAGERLETPVSVRLTLISLHQNPQLPPGAETAHSADRPPGYGAPTGLAGGSAAEFDFATSALALPEGGIAAHGATPAGAGVAAAQPAQEAPVPATGKRAPATLASTLIKVGERAQPALPVAPQATRIYAQTFAGEDAAALPGGKPGTSGGVGAAPSLPHTAPAGGPVQASLAAATEPQGILRPGNQFTARLVAASEGAPARQGLGNIAAGDSITLTVLAAGAEHANLAHSRAFVGVITSAAEIAASAKDITGLGLASPEENPTAVARPETPVTSPEGVERRAAPRSGPQSDKHYIKSPAGAFLFHAAEKIAIGTHITLTGSPAAAPTGAVDAAQSLAQSPAAPRAATPAAAALPQDQAVQSPAPGVPNTPALPPLVSYPAAWPLVDEMIEAVAAADPAAASSLAPRISAPGARLASGLLFFLSAVGMQNPRRWIGEQAARALEAGGKGNLLVRIKEEFARLGRFSADAPGADWRAFLVPLQTEHGTGAIAILTRPHHEEDEGKSGGKDGNDDEDLTENQRFLLEVKLSTLGPVQLDGLMRPERLDMVIRAGNMMTPAMQQDLRQIFENATTAAGLQGGLSFEPLSQSPVDVARVLAEALPGDHDAGAVV